MISQGISANLNYSTGENDIFTNILITVLVNKKFTQLLCITVYDQCKSRY